MAFLSAFLKEKCIQLMHEKFIVLPCGEYITGNVVYIFFLKMYFVTKSKLAFTRNMRKCNCDFMKKPCLAATWT